MHQKVLDRTRDAANARITASITAGKRHCLRSIRSSKLWSYVRDVAVLIYGLTVFFGLAVSNKRGFENF